MADEQVAATAIHWAIVPFIGNTVLTQQATLDLLAQTVPTRVLLVDQGSDRETSDRMREFAEQHHPRVLLWTFLPALPSLSAVWNRALRFVWELGGVEALVINNDTRTAPKTVELLRVVLLAEDALFVSAVGVREGQYNPDTAADAVAQMCREDATKAINKGGPDFSCFLISQAGHWKYPFDENFQPAFCEDLDAHRRYMLGGDGQRIFSVNIPYLHYASMTVKSYSPEQRMKFNQQYDACLAYYARKWGDRPNLETLLSPFGEHEPPHGGVCTATPDLQRRCLAGLHPYDDTPHAPDGVGGTHSGPAVVPAAGSAGIVPAP